MTRIVYSIGESSDEFTVHNQSKWRLNDNGSLAMLTLQSEDNLRLTGFISDVDGGGREDRIEGGWNDDAGEITFTRFLGDSTITQTYRGFLGSNHPEQLLLAGDFTESDAPQELKFGWFASSAALIT